MSKVAKPDGACSMDATEASASDLTSRRDNDSNFSKHISIAVMLLFCIVLRLQISIYQMPA
jgi:hypothetical protein